MKNGFFTSNFPVILRKKINNWNVKLQGKNITIIFMVSTLKSFKEILSIVVNATEMPRIQTV